MTVNRKAMAALVFNMIVRGADRDEIDRVIAYLSLIIDCEKSFKKLDIKDLIEKYSSPVEEPKKRQFNDINLMDLGADKSLDKEITVLDSDGKVLSIGDKVESRHTHSKGTILEFSIFNGSMGVLVDIDRELPVLCSPTELKKIEESVDTDKE